MVGDRGANGAGGAAVGAAIEDADLIITIDDVAACGLCGRGTRRWFERYGLDFRAFLKSGAPASQLLATGDALAARVVARKRGAGR